MKITILKGDIIYHESPAKLTAIANGYVIAEKGIVKGVYSALPSEYADVSQNSDIDFLDYTGKLIIPGMTDLHVHAPQYTFRGIGMDQELLTWLDQYTFPEEAKYSDLSYAKRAYRYFTEDLRRGFTTRAVIFATLHKEATIELMDQLEDTGLITYAGKVNMDRNSNPELQEESPNASITATKEWISEIAGKYKRTAPILTPRFIPSCSNELMKQLGRLSKDTGLRIQSHLSENQSEIAWVRELVPQADCYANAYEIFDAIGSEKLPAVMAHCVYSDKREMEILKNHGTFIAHCPSSNMNLTSGIAPVRKFLDAGIPVGLGTDVAAGSSMNMLQTILLTIQASKMYYRLVDQSVKPLTFEEAFYLATEGGGSYFGKVGSFKEGYEFDALVLDDSTMYSMRPFTLRERMERACYNDADVRILAKYVRGTQVYQK
ncbi:MAG: amidohydrolase family protein [Lachnospiraceae bacterium]|nr:amidohydrolase family protein [Lachnospiraceae bacterium]